MDVLAAAMQPFVKLLYHLFTLDVVYYINTRTMYEKCLPIIFLDIIGSILITREFKAPRAYLILSEVSENCQNYWEF